MSSAVDAKIEVSPILIGGRRTSAAGGETIDAVNPATGQVVGRIPRCRAEDVDAAVDAASAALPAWRDAEPADRAECLLRLAAAIEADGERLAGLDVIDNGSPLHEMRKDVGVATSQLRYFAGLALHARGETLPSVPGRLNYTLRQPYGVVGRIIPFNHPLMFAAAKIAEIGRAHV